MKQYDMPVRLGGKTFRLVTDGENGGLFSQGGLAQTVTVIADGRGSRAPSVVDANGEALEVRKVARPCSCRGYPWNANTSTLVGELS